MESVNVMMQQTSLTAADAQHEPTNMKDILHETVNGIDVIRDYKFSESVEQTIGAIYLSLKIFPILVVLACICFAIFHGVRCCISCRKVQKHLFRYAIKYIFPACMPYIKQLHHKSSNNGAFIPKKVVEGEGNSREKPHWFHKNAGDILLKGSFPPHQRIFHLKTDMNGNNLNKLRHKEQQHGTNNTMQRPRNKIVMQKFQIIKYIDNICRKIEYLNYKIGKWSNFLHALQCSESLNSVLKSKMGIEIIKELDRRTFEVTSLQVKALHKIAKTLQHLKNAVLDINECQWKTPKDHPAQQLQADVNAFLNDYVTRELYSTKHGNPSHYRSKEPFQHLKKQ